MRGNLPTKSRRPSKAMIFAQTAAGLALFKLSTAGATPK